MASTLAFAGDQASTNLTINATVGARAKLVLSTLAINFSDAEPDTTASIPAAENAVSVTVKVRTGSSLPGSSWTGATLTHQAAGNLTSGTNSIPVSNISWTATGTGFSSGTMSSSIPQRVGSWSGSAVYMGL